MLVGGEPGVTWRTAVPAGWVTRGCRPAAPQSCQAVREVNSSKRYLSISKGRLDHLRQLLLRAVKLLEKLTPALSHCIKRQAVSPSATPTPALYHCIDRQAVSPKAAAESAVAAAHQGYNAARAVKANQLTVSKGRLDNSGRLLIRPARLLRDTNASQRSLTVSKGKRQVGSPAAARQGSKAARDVHASHLLK